MDWDLIIIIIYKIVEFLTYTYLKPFHLLLTDLKNMFISTLLYTINLFSPLILFFWEEFILQLPNYYLNGQEELVYAALRPIYDFYLDIYWHIQFLKPYILDILDILNYILKEILMYFQITPINQLVVDVFGLYWLFGNWLVNSFDRSDNDWELNVYSQILGQIWATWIAFHDLFRKMWKKDKLWNAKICFESCKLIINVGLANIIIFLIWAYAIEFCEPKLAYDWIWLNTPPPIYH